MSIAFPVTVNGVEFGRTDTIIEKSLFGRTKCGDFVAVRPCDPKHNGKPVQTAVAFPNGGTVR